MVGFCDLVGTGIAPVKKKLLLRFSRTTVLTTASDREINKNLSTLSSLLYLILFYAAILGERKKSLFTIKLVSEIV